MKVREMEASSPVNSIISHYRIIADCGIPQSTTVRCTMQSHPHLASNVTALGGANNDNREKRKHF